MALFSANIQIIYAIQSGELVLFGEFPNPPATFVDSDGDEAFEQFDGIFLQANRPFPLVFSTSDRSRSTD